MNPEEKRGIRARHVLVVILGLGATGVLVWIIQLARQGEPVGYMLLTAVVILAALGVFRVMLGFVLRQVVKAQSQPPRQQADLLKDIQMTQRVLAEQNRHLRQLAAGRSTPDWPVYERELQLGQVRTPEGYVINGAVFDGLDEE